MSYKQRLELDWIDKDKLINLEPRILIEDEEKSLGSGEKSENLLIHGDNLLALKALEQKFSGEIKCIYIDPPYNTGNAFEFYDDNLEHSKWLNLMKPRLDILHKLLRKDGFMCVQIDDSEGAYLKVLMDEVFGRDNYLTTLYVQVRYPEKTLKQDMAFHKQIEQVLIYRKEYGAVPNLPTVESNLDKYIFYVEESAKGREIELGGKKVEIFTKEQFKVIKSDPSETGRKEIWASGTILDGNSSGRFFRDYLTGRYEEDGLGVIYKVYGIGDDAHKFRYFSGPKREGATKGKYYQGVPLAQLENKNKLKTKPIENFYDFAANFGNCRHEGGVEFRSGKKPEKLISMLIKHFSSEGDWVLDSFAGSGATPAVAHKMNRKWIAIELKDHCEIHILKRMNSVCSGEDDTGVSKEFNWTGGGGFKFLSLASSLLQKDDRGNWVINNEYNAVQLAEAVAKHEKFKFCPDATVYWKQGYSTERDFIFVTTQFLTSEHLDRIQSQMKKDESLLICAKAYRVKKDKYPNITLKKIPQMLPGRCEFGKDDYSLDIKEAVQEELNIGTEA